MVNCLQIIWNKSEAISINLIQYFEADFLWKVGLKMLNSVKFMETFTHGDASKEFQERVFVEVEKRIITAFQSKKSSLEGLCWYQ